MEKKTNLWLLIVNNIPKVVSEDINTLFTYAETTIKDIKNVTSIGAWEPMENNIQRKINTVLSFGHLEINSFTLQEIFEVDYV